MTRKINRRSSRAWLPFVLCAMGSTLGAHAQGYLTDATTTHAVLTRDPARQASTEIDAVVTNPAGTAFMTDGLHLSASGIFSFRNIGVTDLNLPAGTMDAKETRFLPAVQVAYKKNRWALSASFSSEGGYGRLKAKDGDLDVNSYVNAMYDEYLDEINETFMLEKLVFGLAVPGGAPDVDMREDDRIVFESRNIKAKLYNWTTRLGVSYRFNDYLSAYVGIKANRVYFRKNGSVRGAVVRPSTNEKWSASEYYQSRLDVMKQDDSNYELKDEMVDLLNSDVERWNSFEQQNNGNAYASYGKGWGFAPIIGLDFNYKDFNIGAKYEFASHVNWGGTSDFNIPANLSIGLSWQASDKWKVAAGSDIVLPEDKSFFASGKVNTAYNISASATYYINDKWLASGGYTYAHEQFMANGSQTPASISHTNRISLGVAYNPIDKLKIDFGVSTTLHDLEAIWNSHLTDQDLDVSYGFKGQYEFKPRIQAAVGISWIL